MSYIVGFGEIMLRLTAPDGERLLQTPSLKASLGGGEANVCVSCARFGLKSRYVTALPKNAIGLKAEELLLGQKVDTSAIAWEGERIGVYFIERGANQRSSTVVYDRTHSSISEANKDDFDWDKVFDGASWFHVSGITPAITQSAADMTLYAVKEAKKRGVTISFDFNYRKKLWKYGKTPADVIPSIVELADILMANEQDMINWLGVDYDLLKTKPDMDPEDYIGLFDKIQAKFPNLKAVTTTLRRTISSDNNNWSAVYYTDKKLYTSKQYSITNIVDRVGGGDSYAGGLISGLNLYPNDPQMAVEFATAASCLKHSIYGDWNLVSKSEVENLIGGDGRGLVQR